MMSVCSVLIAFDVFELAWYTSNLQSKPGAQIYI